MGSIEEQCCDYIIVGAGPAGLQMAYFLQQARMSYLVLESGQEAGTFFRDQPRHRKLISINKRYNVFPEDEFNLRHDWNSLLSHDPGARFTSYSDDLFPHADLMVQYLNDYAHRFELNIRYNTRVSRISKRSDTDAEFEFEIRDAQGVVFCCKRLLMATGAVRDNLPVLEGIEHADTYVNHSLDKAQYRNKKVCIVGGGNSAFEVGSHISSHAGLVHYYAHTGVRLAWDTHFVGDLRAVNNDSIDMYHLKSLHAIRLATINRLSPAKAKDGQPAVKVNFDMDLPHWSPPGTAHFYGVYDKVIVCTGWKYVLPEMFDESCMPEVTKDGRYPVLDEMWETSVPNMYYIGAAMQQRDRRAASGFIHGFRYNVRTLFHLLQQKYHNLPLRRHCFPCLDLDDVTTFLINRVSTTSGLYQQNHNFLCDVLIFHEKSDTDSVAGKYIDKSETVSVTGNLIGNTETDSVAGKYNEKSETYRVTGKSIDKTETDNDLRKSVAKTYIDSVAGKCSEKANYATRKYKKTETDSVARKSIEKTETDDVARNDSNNNVEYSVEYLYELPTEWVLKQTRLMSARLVWIVTLGDSRHKFPGGINPTAFNRPPDLQIVNNSCSAFTEPIMHCYRNGRHFETLHVGGSLTVRHDAGPIGGSNPLKATNKVKNWISSQLELGHPEYDQTLFSDELWGEVFTPWGEERKAQEKEKNRLKRTSGPCNAAVYDI